MGVVEPKTKKAPANAEARRTVESKKPNSGSGFARGKTAK
jgi:hypothetical protein